MADALLYVYFLAIQKISRLYKFLHSQKIHAIPPRLTVLAFISCKQYLLNLQYTLPQKKRYTENFVVHKFLHSQKIHAIHPGITYLAFISC